jgi:hypothetical protein
VDSGIEVSQSFVNTDCSQIFLHFAMFDVLFAAFPICPFLQCFLFVIFRRVSRLSFLAVIIRSVSELSFYAVFHSCHFSQCFSFFIFRSVSHLSFFAVFPNCPFCSVSQLSVFAMFPNCPFLLCFSG